jgi:hypothetical protein
MKVIIHGPSLPLLLVAIVLGLPVAKAPTEPRRNLKKLPSEESVYRSK